MTYNLFRHERLTNLYCAVSQHKPIPEFIRSPTWTFAGVSTPNQPRPKGFDEEVARFTTNFQGFYTYYNCTALQRKQSRMIRDLQREHENGGMRQTIQPGTTALSSALA
jgi:hypothetical protein